MKYILDDQASHLNQKEDSHKLFKMGFSFLNLKKSQ